MAGISFESFDYKITNIDLSERLEGFKCRDLSPEEYTNFDRYFCHKLETIHIDDSPSYWALVGKDQKVIDLYHELGRVNKQIYKDLDHIFNPKDIKIMFEPADNYRSLTNQGRFYNTTTGMKPYNCWIFFKNEDLLSLFLLMRQDKS